MKIAVPIAAFENGTTGEYMATAFRQLGHEATILSQWNFYEAFRKDEYDVYFCVDSGGPINFFEMSILNGPWKKLSMWLIDYRRGKTLKNPNDFDTCKFISSMGGWVFQANYEDLEDCLKNGIVRVSWLPLAADPDVWSGPSMVPPGQRPYDVAFVGNVWDGARQQALEDIRRAGLQLAWFGHGAAYKEAGAEVLRQARLGFNISSFFGEPVAYDINMRVFETLACGLPLVTNFVPSLNRLFGTPLPPFIVVYHQLDQIVPVIRRALWDGTVEWGGAARYWAAELGTYKLRAEQAMATLKDQAKAPLGMRVL